MENQLKISKNQELWKSVSEKVRKIGGGVAASVEESLTSSYIAELQVAVEKQTCGAQMNHQRNLQEALDVLHDCLVFEKPGNEQVHVAVRQAYLIFCQALLRAEAEEIGRLQTEVARSLEKLSCLPRPLHKHIPQLQDAVIAVKKSAQLLKRRASAVYSGKERLLLLGSQTLIGLKLLLVAVKDLEIPFPGSPQVKAGVSYVLSRLVWCLEEATSENEGEDSIAQCGQFIGKMDEAMTMLETESKDLPGLKTLCEDLLGHAMSVAHVALGNDAELISQISQKVLAKMQDLNISDENPVLKNLRLGCIADALLLLEQTVNTSLLRLVLEVFAKVSAPLKQIFNAKTEDEVKEKVAAFDLHVDRIMQAGMFAIACSSDTTRVAGVRSCLASLESMESELVPAILAYRNAVGKPEENVALKLAQFYAQHWKIEAKKLDKLLDQLVDPPAFCQVTSDEICKHEKIICETCDKNIAKLHSEYITRYAFKLYVLLASLSQLQEPVGCESEAITDLAFFLEELKTAEYMQDNDKWLHRVRKRTRLVSKAVATISEQMQASLSRDNVFPITHTTTIVNDIKVAPGVSEEDIKSIVSDEPVDGETSKQFFPDSVRDLPMDITASPTKSVAKPVYDLTPFLARGKQLCDARSVLYRTPIATPASARLAPQIELIEMQDLSEDCAARQLFAPDTTAATEQEDSMMLNITGILDDLTGLSDTLSSEISEVEVQPSQVLANKKRSGKIGASLRLKKAPSSSEIPPHSRTYHGVTSVSELSNMWSPSIGSQGISTDERLRDLQLLQARLLGLKHNLSMCKELTESKK